MADITLVTGGCRSGKSRFALAAAERLEGPRAFLATCPVLDAEMDARIEKHRRERAGRGWDTLEVPVDLEGALRKPLPYRVLLLDCLSLWINNLLYEAEQAGRTLEEDEVAARCSGLLQACAVQPFHLFVVTNEVGMGIVPENTLARRYRDLLGRANQVIAAAADTAVFLVSGIPLPLKGRAPWNS